MSDFKGGVREAAKLLAALDRNAREHILEIIAKQNPTMAEALRSNMVVFEDLCYLTPKMLQELLREIKIDDLSLSLRISTKKLKEFFLSQVSSSMRAEMEELLNGPPVPKIKAEEAMARIMDLVRRKMDKGEIVLDREGSQTLV